MMISRDEIHQLHVDISASLRSDEQMLREYKDRPQYEYLHKILNKRIKNAKSMLRTIEKLRGEMVAEAVKV